MHRCRRILFALAGLLLVACVQVDPDTGDTKPRGHQRYRFDTVTRRAEKLVEGLTKTDVLLLLGSPAEKSDDGEMWVYLPERAAVVVPGRSLRLEFERGRLADYGYRPIIFGVDF